MLLVWSRRLLLQSLLLLLRLVDKEMLERGSLVVERLFCFTGGIVDADHVQRLEQAHPFFKLDEVQMAGLSHVVIVVLIVYTKPPFL